MALAPPRKNTSTRKRSERRSVATLPQQRLEGLLGSLSLALEETARQYVLRLQREIAQISEVVATPQPRGSGRGPNPKTLEALCKKFESLQVKPGKGRRKDLKRIDDLIGELENILHGA